MNFYLAQMILKFLRMIFIAVISLFNITLYSENENVSKNNIINQNNYAVHTVTIQEEQKVKKVEKTNTTSKKSSSVNNVVKKEDPEPNKVVTTEEPKTVPKQSNAIETFTGRLTGYGHDCAGCSGYGNLACKTREKKTFSLKTQGIYYNDTEYGKVRILAAATSKFKCGSIIKVTKSGQTPFTAVVLDTGGSMRKAWANGTVWMDLAYESNAMAGSDNLTGTNIKFEVQRYGW